MEFLNATFSADTQGLTGGSKRGANINTLPTSRCARRGFHKWRQEHNAGYLLLLNFVTTTSFSSVRFYFDSGSRGVSRPRTEDTPQAYSLRGFPS
ncbi:hypothetical protein PC121_g18116 [Phytophthora cactorum]|nr:hypothetical protein PC121_g18116 [Phytophthora cactorum]